MPEKSCGTIPYTVKNNFIYYLLVKSKCNGYCGFPKGHMENGEKEEETAFRETLEETSLRVTIDRNFRREITYRLNNGIDKTVVYFLGNFQDQTPVRNGNFEDFEYLLLSFDGAYKALTFDNTKQILKEANEFLTSATKNASLV